MSALLGRLPGPPQGDGRCGAHTASASAAERKEGHVTGHDLGLATVTGSIAVRGGGSTSLTVAYVVPDAVRTVNGAKEITLRVLPQPTMAGVRHEIRVVLPEGSTILSASRELDRQGDTALFSGIQEGAVDLDLRFGLGQN